MALKILWHPPLVPEVRKRAQWEKIIRFELGEDVEGLDVNLTYAENRLRWHLDAGPDARQAGARRARLVEALRATGKPVD